MVVVGVVRLSELVGLLLDVQPFVKVEECAILYDPMLVVPGKTFSISEIPQPVEDLPVGEWQVVRFLRVPFEGHGEYDAVQPTEHLDVGLGQKVLVDHRRVVLVAVFQDTESVGFLNVAGKLQ